MSARDVDAYFAMAPKEARAMLKQLRATVKSAAPRADEAISYGMPMYKYHGLLVGFAAFKHHVGFYGVSGPYLDAFADELTSYETGKGTVRFPIGQPIPVALVKKLVKAKARANERNRAGSHPPRR